MEQLHVYDPRGDEACRARLAQLCRDLDLPAPDYPPAPERPFAGPWEGHAFLHAAAAEVLRPQYALPLSPLLSALNPEAPRCANVLRRMLELRSSLRLFYANSPDCRDIPGGFLLGGQLLVAVIDPENRVDVPLPPGVWTDVTAMTCHTGRLLGMRGANETPVLAAPDTRLTFLPARGDMPERPHTYWFEPQQPLSLPGVIMVKDGEMGF